MFLDNTQTNSTFVCVLSKNIGLIAFIYESICSLHPSSDITMENSKLRKESGENEKIVQVTVNFKK